MRPTITSVKVKHCSPADRFLLKREPRNSVVPHGDRRPETSDDQAAAKKEGEVRACARERKTV